MPGIFYSYTRERMGKAREDGGTKEQVAWQHGWLGWTVEQYPEGDCDGQRSWHETPSDEAMCTYDLIRLRRTELNLRRALASTPLKMHHLETWHCEVGWLIPFLAILCTGFRLGNHLQIGGESESEEKNTRGRLVPGQSFQSTSDYANCHFNS